MLALLIAHGLALAAWAGFVEWEIRYNAQRIHVDMQAGQDSLRRKFHRQRLTIRAVVAMVLTIGVAMAALPVGVAMVCSGFGFLAMATAWFGYRFNSGLNKARGLAPWYVSFTPWASQFDQWFAKRTRQKYGSHTVNMSDEARERYLHTRAGCSLRNAMRLGLIFGAAVYFGCVGTAIALTL